MNVKTKMTESQKKLGRPPGVTQDRLFQMRVNDEFLAIVDEWRAKQRPILSRSEAIRRLVEQALAENA